MTQKNPCFQSPRKSSFAGASTIHSSPGVCQLAPESAPRVRPRGIEAWSDSACDAHAKSLRLVCVGRDSPGLGKDERPGGVDSWCEQQGLQVERGLCLKQKLKKACNISRISLGVIQSWLQLVGLEIFVGRGVYHRLTFITGVHA
jgi:hypothetical protein